MANTVYVLEAVNLFVGIHDPSASNHLVLQSLKLPGLEENFTDHTPTGAPVGTEVDTHVNRLEAGFNLAGWQPWVMQLFGSPDRRHRVFTAYAAVRDRRTGELLEAKAIMEGRLGRADPQNNERGTMHQMEYAIRALVHYEFYLGRDEIYKWDFFTSVRRVGGVDLNADLNRILRIPASA